MQPVLDTYRSNNYFKVSSYQALFVYIAYAAACSMNFFSWQVATAASLFRYIIAVFVLFSFDWFKWDKFKVFLIVFLVVSLAARRLLIVWTLVAMVYQIYFLRIPIKNLAKIGVIVIGIIFLYQIEALLFGLVKNDSVFSLKVSRFIYDLGTGNTNRIGALVLFFLMLLYLLMKDNRKIMYFVFYFTGCRTAFYGILILNLVAVFYWNGWIRNWMKWIISLMPILFFIGTFYLAANMDDNENVNSVASGRLYFIVKFTKEYTMREWLIGAPIEDDAPLDSSYLSMITTGGISLALFFCAGFFAAIIRYFKSIGSYLPFVLALIAAGLTETYFVGPNSVSVILWIIVLMPFIKYAPKL